MATGAGETLKSGYLFKLSGKKWKKRYFVLTDFFLYYYKKEDAVKVKGVVDLKTGRGVRPMEHCEVQWPGGVAASICFGLATEARTYYLHGSHEGEIREWMELLGQVIEKNGTPTPDWQGDPVGKSGGAAKIPGSQVDALTVVDRTMNMATGSGLLSDACSLVKEPSKKKLAKVGAKAGVKAGRFALKAVTEVVKKKVPALGTAMSVAGTVGKVAETAVKGGVEVAKAHQESKNSS